MQLKVKHRYSSNKILKTPEQDLTLDPKTTCPLIQKLQSMVFVKVRRLLSSGKWVGIAVSMDLYHLVVCRKKGMGAGQLEAMARQPVD